MLLYAPCNEIEYPPILGGLTEEQFDLFERRLRKEMPEIRFLKLLEEAGFPRLQRFTLKIHHEDRDRATPAIHETMELISPLFPGIVREEREIAALVRQYVRAKEACDQTATELMTGYLARHLGYLLERLLVPAKLQWLVDLRLDGINSLEVTIIPPFELEVLGYVSIGRSSDGSQAREPFVAELRASSNRPELERFVARFGDLNRLTSEGVIKGGFPDNLLAGDTAYRMRVGSSVNLADRHLVDWAFEVAKVVE
jgi:hypothetical protein